MRRSGPQPTCPQTGSSAGWQRRTREAQGELAELRGQDQSRLASRTTDLERRLFGLAGHTNGADAISARAALDRASQLRNVTEAVALLARAESTGDDTLARAIASTALQRGKSSVSRQQAAAWDGGVPGGSGLGPPGTQLTVLDVVGVDAHGAAAAGVGRRALPGDAMVHEASLPESMCRP